MFLKNANIVTNGNNLRRVNIFIEDGKIKDIFEGNLSDNVNDSETIDCTNYIVFPGFIDAHVHFDDPGYTEREDFFTGTQSAAKGGVTTVIDMPCTSIPEVTTKENLLYKLEIVSKKAFVDFAFWGGVTPMQLHSGEYKKTIKDLKKEGVVGLKLYTISGMKTYPRVNTEEMASIFEYIKELGLVAGIHAEDFELVDYFSRREQNLNHISPLAWTKGRNYEAEAVAILRSIALAREFKNKVHIVHLSTKLGLMMIEMAKSDGVDITAETCPHYLIFNEEDLNRIGAILKTAPPVRKKEDSEYLWNGLKTGSIDFITTDHAGGVYPEEKSRESIWDNYAGIPGVQTRFYMLFTFGYSKGRLTLEDLKRVLSENVAKRFGLKNKGRIEVGFDADFVLVNPFQDFKFNAKEDLLCKNKYSPFDGFTFNGIIEKTILRGKVVYDKKEGILANQGFGKFIKSEY
ncbi:allantoinase AllB [Caldisericum exile]|uniref:allantoinase n=1 Tax=Caldisericum exile (strain DSM 21853 / NBRC 104410 / AZM16c01) TaxID=511051 RepID=A0A7U6GEQ4_CALEA|nr:allantoinase AllB [Caldisericum exile]BAL81028.1 amidohydrolase [Caldisericum exile AZM16c01]